MYNGLGLRTARGSGTSGYVQKNKSFTKPKQQNYQYLQAPPKKHRKPTAALLLHRQRRKIELECIVYKKSLISTECEEGELDSVEIEKMVSEFKKEKLAELEAKQKDPESLKIQKEKEMERLRDAFGISDTLKEGDAFKFESEEQRAAKMARYAEEDRLDRLKKNRE